MVAIFSVAILGGLFLGPDHYPAQLRCFASAATMFLTSSAIIIGTVIAVRHWLTVFLSRSNCDVAAAPIFSLEEEQVWASWTGEDRRPLLLGPKSKVSAMMKDFLAQVEVGERLNRLRQLCR